MAQSNKRTQDLSQASPNKASSSELDDYLRRYAKAFRDKNQYHMDLSRTAIDRLITKRCNDRLAEFAKTLPEWFPDCSTYPDKEGTWCNQCFYCRHRNDNDFTNGFEYGVDHVRGMIDTELKRLEGKTDES